MAHAVLSPSSSKMWLTCTPSARLNEKLKARFGEQSSVFAAEGTTAHALSEMKLRKENGEINEFLYGKEREALGDIPNEMDNKTDDYVDTVLSEYYAAAKFCPDAKLFVEVKLDMNNWVPHCFGTSDAVVVSDDILVVIDLKYGQGVPVSAIGNPQARLYGLGAAREFSERFGGLYAFKKVKTMIVQPRLESVTEEELTLDELVDWGNSIVPNAKLAWEGKGNFSVGDHCRFCAAKAICAARASEAMRIFQDGLGGLGTIPDSEIPRILDVIPAARDWMKAIEDYALNQAKQGTEFKGYKLVRGKKGTRRWTSEREAVNTLARAGYTPDQYEESGLKSVAGIEKLLGKSTFSALLGELTVQAEGALTLVPEDDKREAVPSETMAIAGMLD